VKSSVYSELQSEVGQHAFAIACDESLARIWRQANEDMERLTDDERIRFFSFAMSQFGHWENVYFQHRHSMIDDEAWDEPDRLVRPHYLIQRPRAVHTSGNG
jgi:hypothetical protein